MTSTSPTEPQRLLYITYARQDEAWVQGVLVPALGLAAGQYRTRAETDLRALQLEEVERAVQACRYTLLVASSAARVDQWAQLAGLLAGHLGIEEGKPRLLLITRDFEPRSERARELLPLRQRCLVCLDCSDPEQTAAALATLAAQLALTATDEPPAECPYPGLRMFGTGDSESCFHRTDLFFGRDQEGRELVDRLRRGGRALLVGPSGCGKSSLVRARVLPTLSRGGDAMAIVVARPGAHPDAALRAALDALDPRLGPATDAHLDAEDEQATHAAHVAVTAWGGLLLYVDQLEEVFLDDADPCGERAAFFARLTALGRVPGVAILLGMRADFYGDLMRSPAWDEFKDHRVELAPLRGDALRLAITRPAERVGVHVEADLVERLVREADHDRAAEALPLLQVALEQLWAQREWRYLSLASYARLAEGERRGLDAVLARHADANIDVLAEPLRELARRVLIDLVHLGEGRPDTRRRRTEDELRRAGDDGAALAQVIEHLSARRLITTGAEVATERHVDLAHDTLITGWPALAHWIAQRRDDLRTQRRLEARAAGGGLLAVSELPEFTRWVAWIATPAGQALGASEALRTLVRRSVAARTRRIAALIGFIIMLVAAAGGALWQRGVAVDNAELAARRQVAEANARRTAEAANDVAQAQTRLATKEADRATKEADRATREARRATEQTVEAERQRRQADRQREEARHQLGRNMVEQARSLLLDQSNPTLAISSLQEAIALGVEDSVLRTVLASLRSYVWEVAFFHRGAVVLAAFSPDGTLIITASSDSTARIWDAATGHPRGDLLQLQGSVRSVAFSPDGARIVTASEDNTARIWDAATGRPLGAPLQHQDSVRSAVFSPDGARVVTTSEDNTARVWDAANGRLLVGPLQHQGRVESAAFSSDGARVVTAGEDNTARIWDAATGRPLGAPLQHQSYVESAAFSPDGARVVTASSDNTARIWDTATGRPLGAPLQHQGSVRSAAFSADGARVVTASGDSTARVWDAATGRPLGPALQHQGYVESAAFSPDGARVVTASSDNTARIWDAATGRPLGASLRHPGLVYSAAFSPDGAYVVTAGDATARVWDAASRPSGAPLQHQGRVGSAVFSPDSARVVTASWDKTARVWDAASGRSLGAPLQHQGPIRSATFSPDGSRVVTASWDKTARVWDAASGRPLGVPLQHQGKVTSAAFSPDGVRVVTASEDNTARIWDAATGRPLAAPFQHPNPVHSATFSPDGARVVVASDDGTARVWDAVTGRPLGAPLQHKGPIHSAAFSPDASRVVTASWDKTARVWDAVTGEPLGISFQHQSWVKSATFSPDGTRVVTASGDNTARVWDAATDGLLVAPLQHQGPVRGAAFSPDGARIVTASEDNTARVWDAATGRPLVGPLQHQGPVRGAAFSPDGTRVVTITSNDNTARVWDVVETGSLAAWSEQAKNCIASPSGDALSVRCQLFQRRVSFEEVIAHARSFVAAGDQAIFSRVWALPRAAYQKALQLLDNNKDGASPDSDHATELRRAVAFRLAVLDAIEGHLPEARARYGPAAPKADAKLLNLLGRYAHDQLYSDFLAIGLLGQARELAPNDPSILSNLAEAYFASGQFVEATRAAVRIAPSRVRPDQRVALATLAWAISRLTQAPDRVQAQQLERVYADLPNFTSVGWSWKGTRHAVAYGRYSAEQSQPVLDVLRLLEEQVLDGTRARLSLLLAPPNTPARSHSTSP